MGKSVTFVSDVNGSSVSKTKKRMRGDTNRRPEIKIWDPCSEYAAQYATKTCYCVYSRNVPTADLSPNGLYNHSPYRLGYPGVGVSANQRIGNEFFLKYIRLKGYVWTTNYNPLGIRWRLVLLKVNPAQNVSLDTSGYLNKFLDTTISNPASWGTPGSITNFDNTEDGALRNYYMKVKDVQEWVGFKRKVIASGYVPPNFSPFEINGGTITAGESGTVTQYALFTAGDGDASTEYRHAQPLDVKVTLNDRINAAKYTSIYWLIFEADCGVGIKLDPTQESRLVSDETYANGSPLMVHFLARAYFTDA